MFDFCLCTRLREQTRVFHYKVFNNSNFIVQFWDCFYDLEASAGVESVSSSTVTPE